MIPNRSSPKPRNLRTAARTAALALALLVAGIPLHAQEHQAASGEHDEESRPRHRLALFSGTTLVPESSHEGAIDGLIAAPTIGFDYAFRPSERFAISWINDFQLDQYVIERSDGSDLQRERLFVTSLVLMWEAMPRMQLFAGPGLERDKHEVLRLLKIGLEWELFEPHPWDVALNFAWDVKEEYDALAFGLSIGRLWE